MFICSNSKKIHILIDGYCLCGWTPTMVGKRSGQRVRSRIELGCGNTKLYSNYTRLSDEVDLVKLVSSYNFSVCVRCAHPSRGRNPEKYPLSNPRVPWVDVKRLQDLDAGLKSSNPVASQEEIPFTKDMFLSSEEQIEFYTAIGAKEMLGSTGFECNNCDCKPTARELVTSKGWCPRCDESVTAYTLDVAEEIVAKEEEVKKELDKILELAERVDNYLFEWQKGVRSITKELINQIKKLKASYA